MQSGVEEKTSALHAVSRTVAAAETCKKREAVRMTGAQPSGHQLVQRDQGTNCPRHQLQERELPRVNPNPHRGSFHTRDRSRI